MSYRVYLKKKEDRRIREGHAWVYANEVERIEGEGHNGDLATVYDHTGVYVGKGYINHLSKILVRILIRGDEEPGMELFKNASRPLTTTAAVSVTTTATAWSLPRPTICPR